MLLRLRFLKPGAKISGTRRYQALAAPKVWSNGVHPHVNILIRSAVGAVPQIASNAEQGLPTDLQVIVIHGSEDK